MDDFYNQLESILIQNYNSIFPLITNIKITNKVNTKNIKIDILLILKKTIFNFIKKFSKIFFKIKFSNQLIQFLSLKYQIKIQIIINQINNYNFFDKKIKLKLKSSFLEQLKKIEIKLSKLIKKEIEIENQIKIESNIKN